MAQHAQLRIDTGLAIYFCDPHSPWQRAPTRTPTACCASTSPRTRTSASTAPVTLVAVAAALNSRPLKILGWSDPDADGARPGRRRAAIASGRRSVASARGGRRRCAPRPALDGASSFPSTSRGCADVRRGLDSTGTPRLGDRRRRHVVLEVGAGVPAVRSTIGPPLAEGSARGQPPRWPSTATCGAPRRPGAAGSVRRPRRAGLLDRSARGARVRAWLPNGPAFGLDTGVHTHGDGLVYVHPFETTEAGDLATLGLMLQRGRWAASADWLRLWDGVEHRSGTRCPDGLARHRALVSRRD